MASLIKYENFTKIESLTLSLIQHSLHSNNLPLWVGQRIRKCWCKKWDREKREKERERYRDRQWAGCEASPTDGQSFKPTLSFYGRDRTHVVQGSTLNQDSNNDFTLWPVLKLPAGHSCYKAQYPFAKAWQPFGTTTASLRRRKRERKGGRDRELSNRCQLSNRARKKKDDKHTLRTQSRWKAN